MNRASPPAASVSPALPLGLSQTAFAHRYHIPARTLRDWEQARVMPPSYALAYIKLIAAHPELVAKEVA